MCVPRNETLFCSHHVLGYRHRIGDEVVCVCLVSNTTLGNVHALRHVVVGFHRKIVVRYDVSQSVCVQCVLGDPSVPV